MTQAPFPEQFSDLEQFRQQWAKPTERQRHHARLAGSVEEMRLLYELMLGHMDDLVTHLNQFPVDDLPAAENDLLLLALAFMEISIPVEIHGTATVPDGFDHRRFEVTF